MSESFEALIRQLRPRLARAFVAAYGLDRGQEALAESMGYAWEHFEQLRKMENPAGYLYRVGQSRTRERARPDFPAPSSVGLPDVEPGLVGALLDLSERQRTCVALVHCYGYTHDEVADLLGISRSSIQSHVERGLANLRLSLGATDHD